MLIARVLTLLLAMTVVSCSAACPLQQATYRQGGAGTPTLRLGPAADGEMILRLDDHGTIRSVPLSQVADRIDIRYLDAARRPVAMPLDQAPALIEIQGLSRISDIPDGEWTRAGCIAPAR
jgi:hypothetical protein